MTATITLFILLAVTLIFVRIGGVALRLTGLSQEIARFQAISALSGTGFTTTESDVIVSHRERRRIVTLLMFVGQMGLITIVSTVLAGLVTAGEGGGSSVFAQVVAFVCAVIVIFLVSANSILDRAMVAGATRVIERYKLITIAEHRLQSVFENGFAVMDFPPGFDDTKLTDEMQVLPHHDPRWRRVYGQLSQLRALVEEESAL